MNKIKFKLIEAAIETNNIITIQNLKPSIADINELLYLLEFSMEIMIILYDQIIYICAIYRNRGFGYPIRMKNLEKFRNLKKLRDKKNFQKVKSAPNKKTAR